MALKGWRAHLSPRAGTDPWFHAVVMCDVLLFKPLEVRPNPSRPSLSFFVSAVMFSVFFISLFSVRFSGKLKSLFFFPLHSVKGNRTWERRTENAGHGTTKGRRIKLRRRIACAVSLCTEACVFSILRVCQRGCCRHRRFFWYTKKKKFIG